MLPGDAPLLVDPILAASYVDTMRTFADALIDYERGGTALNVPDDGLNVQTWTLRYESPAVIVSGTIAPDTTLFSRPGITELALAFDQNMRPFVAFVENGVPRFWWYDTVVGAGVFTDLPVDALHPRCCLDDHREAQSAVSDIILAYTRGADLYYRQQRDRYATEYLLTTGVDGTLAAIGMNTGLRLQFQIGLGDIA